MRTLDKLRDIENSTIIYQYLYMNPEHKITFFNGVVNVEISMDDKFNIIAKTDIFPDLPPKDFNSMFSLQYIMRLIENLKNTPSKVEYFKNYWDEIYSITSANLGLNRPRA